MQEESKNHQISIAYTEERLVNSSKFCFEEELLMAEKWNPISQYEIGLYYLRNDNLQRNYTTAYSWFLRSAKGSIGLAAFNVGLFYFNGHIVEQDYEEAFNWFEQAALGGIAGAIFIMDVLEKKGVTLNQDSIRELKWIEKTYNDTDMMVNIGTLYEEGEEVEQDYDKAYMWFREAAVKDNMRAVEKIKDLFTTKKYFERDIMVYLAINQDDGEAAFDLGILCEEQEKYEEAFYWFMCAAKIGDAEMTKRIADHYSSRECVEYSSCLHK